MNYAVRMGSGESHKERPQVRNYIRRSNHLFEDPLGLDFYDPDHSEDEDRYILLALSKRGRVLLVVYTERKDKIRIISARKATRKEEEFYHENRI